MKTTGAKVSLPKAITGIKSKGVTAAVKLPKPASKMGMPGKAKMYTGNMKSMSMEKCK